MYKQYYKMAIQMLKENPLVSTISILGTALSVAMIMVVVLIYQIQLTGYSPETNRDRMMYVFGTEVVSKDESNRNWGGMSQEVVKTCFYALQTPEAVTAFASENRPISLPGKRLYKEYAIKYTDLGFWSVFDFRFLVGKPFTEADFQSGIRTVVVSDLLARSLFETTDVVGKTIIIDFMEFSICGVVSEVSIQANEAYADLWIPYTTNEQFMTTRFGKAGAFGIALLAKDKKDFAAIRDELERMRTQMNNADTENNVFFPNAPLTRLQIAMGSRGFKYVKPADFILQTGAILLFLLLVPSLNLIGVTQSSVQRRRAELGVRKAFGATPRVLWKQLLGENLVISMIGGVIGFGFSFLLLIWCKEFLLSSQAKLSTEMLIQPVTFIIAFLFVLLLNLLSTAIPAIRIARQPIVDSLKDSDN